jgi:hypothetical protein
MTGRPDRVASFALAYLSLPALVFCVGWLETVPGVMLSLLIFAAVAPLFLHLSIADISPPQPAALAWLFALAALWAGLGGAGHFVFANPDWHTRDAVYSDLIYGTWPPAYRLDGEIHLVLRSATGFFLAPAALAKIAGIGAARWLLYAWSALGTLLFLLLLPLPARLGPRLVLLSLAVVGFSGLDYPAILTVHGHTPMFPLPLEWWRPWTYTSLSGQLFWAPNHALPLWLGTALILRHRDSDALPAVVLVLLPAALLWTPFAIGLLPWAAWALWQRRQPVATLLRATEPFQWAAALALTAVLLAYLSRPGMEATPLAFDSFSNSAGGAAAGWSTVETAIAYLQFAAFEFGILALLLRPATVASRQMLALALTLLLALPLLRLGPSNDWMLRISTPCLVALLVLVLAEFSGPAIELRRSWRAAGLVVVLATGAITPGFEIARALLWKPTPPNYGQSLVEAQRGYLAPHYLGKLDLPLLQWLFKVPTLVPPGKDRSTVAN